MEQTKYFPIYFDSEDALRVLSDEERGQLLLALLDHSLGRDVQELPPAARIAFLLMSSGVDRHAKRYAANVANGQKGGAPEGNQNARKTTENNPNQAKASEKQPTKTKDGKTKDGKIEIKDGIIPSACHFIQPTLEDVKKYIADNGYTNVDAERFITYYTAADWHDKDGNPVKNWKQKIITWSGRGTKKGSKNHGTSDYRDYSTIPNGYSSL